MLVNILWHFEGNFRHINSINLKLEAWLNDTASILCDLFDFIILYYGIIIYDYIKGHKIAYKSYGLTFVCWLIIFALLKLVFEL